jgi:transcriptional regulator with XRE-family HTH domain
VSIERQRQQLTEFLKGCRARISPAEMGLPDQGRRRTPGLRREDVAALAGVSVTWYTWLEQGRAIKVSAEVLERICATLQMSSEERDYIFALVQHRAPPYVPTSDATVSPAIQRMLDTLNTPAFVKTARWDVIAWNEMVTRTFRDYSKLEPTERNLLRILLVDDVEYQQDPEGYYAMACRVLSKFRVDFGQYSEDPSFQELVENLEKDSPVFRELWNSPEVMNRSEAVAYHPQRDGMWFEHTSYIPEGSPGLRLVIFVPHDEATAAKVAELARGQGSPASKLRVPKKKVSTH